MQAEHVDHDRTGYLRDLCRLLWPDPARAELTVRSPSHGRPDLSMIVLPGLRRPRLLVPDERRPAAAAVRRYGEPGSARSAVVTRALSAALASGLGSRLLRDRVVVRVPSGAETIESRLSSLLGQRVLISVHLGAARANRKPVLQLLTMAGETVGFAKVGFNPLTTDLVSAEHRALFRLHEAGLVELDAPRVLGRDHWHGLEILVLSPLPVWEKRTPLAAGLLERAMAEVADVGGRRESALAASEYLALLLARLDAAGDGDEQATLRSLLGELAGLSGDTTLSFGSWHGDWTPWNMACTKSGLLVWDWERFTAPAPLGFDALHYWLQSEVVGRQRDPVQSAALCLDRAPALLEPFGVPASQARLSALLYLADLSARYLADRQERAGAALGAPRRWLLPALTAGVAGLRPAREGG
jgi:hypothetical protein